MVRLSTTKLDWSPRAYGKSLAVIMRRHWLESIHILIAMAVQHGLHLIMWMLPQHFLMTNWIYENAGWICHSRTGAPGLSTEEEH